jgi:hypothetical protein
VDLQRVPRLGSFDEEGPGLRVHLGQVKLGEERLVRDGKRVVGSIAGFRDHGITRGEARRGWMRITIGEVDGLRVVLHGLSQGRQGQHKDEYGWHEQQDSEDLQWADLKHGMAPF